LFFEFNAIIQKTTEQIFSIWVLMGKKIKKKLKKGAFAKKKIYI